jgi:serine/threonine-protein kinase RsbW
MNKPEISGNAIKIPSDGAHIADVDEFIEGKLNNAGVSDSTIADLAISVTELVNNAIIHGNAGDKSKIVSIAMNIDNDQVQVIIKDQGKGFNTETLPDPLDESNLLNQVGRGIFIVRSLMDSLDFHFTESGTEVIIIKKLQS